MASLSLLRRGLCNSQTRHLLTQMTAINNAVAASASLTLRRFISSSSSSLSASSLSSSSPFASPLNASSASIRAPISSIAACNAPFSASASASASSSSSFPHTDILSATQFSLSDLSLIFKTAYEMEQIVSNRFSNPAEYNKLQKTLENKILHLLFYEPSTRTRVSFETAMLRLGGKVVNLTSAESSHQKGETLEDTIHMIDGYTDAIVLRHPVAFSAATAANVANVPVLNAGDGANEHPTQSLLDLYTIYRSFNQKISSSLNITFVGDLKFGRTVHSLAKLLPLFHCNINFVSPDQLKFPIEIEKKIKEKYPKINFKSFNKLENIIKETNVLYVTRVQKERFENKEEYEKLKHSFIISNEILKNAPPAGDFIIMHPLPRVGEILTEVDNDPRAMYFKQSQYGMYVRMALLKLVFENKSKR